MQCTFVKVDGTRCKRNAGKGQRYCWTHEQAVKADQAVDLETQAVELESRADDWLQAVGLESQAVQMESQAVEPKAHPQTKESASWHFASLGGPEGIGVVEYGLPECKDEKLVGEILATPYLQLISCHKNGTILNRFMARPCAAKHHEHWHMGLPGLSSRFPENHFDAGILVGPQSGDTVEAMRRLVKGPIIRV